MRLHLLSLAIFCILASAIAQASDTLLRPENIAIIVNEADPNSVEVGNYYREARGIPERNIIAVHLPENERILDEKEFEELRKAIDAALPPDIDVMVLMWTTPYAVACNSITSALTLGFDGSLCKNSCAPSKPSAYFDSSVRHPFSEAHLRLSMLLPTTNVYLAKSLIDRGKLSTFRMQEASAYFVMTADTARNTRVQFFPPPQRIPSLLFNVQTLRGDAIRNRKDVMIYELGAVTVPYLRTLIFLPGALADHLTSVGGDLLGQSQMSSLRWLEAGATASYGTVSEPCSYWQKFPNPTVLLEHYLSGESAVEAYWKSVAWPAQGLFIGEPLAAPYCQQCRKATLSK